MYNLCMRSASHSNVFGRRVCLGFGIFGGPPEDGDALVYETGQRRPICIAGVQGSSAKLLLNSFPSAACRQQVCLSSGMLPPTA